MPKKHSEMEELEELEAKEEEEHGRLFEVARKFMLASAGAAGLAADEGKNMFNRFVKRGEVIEKESRKLLKEMSGRQRKTVRGIDKRVDKVLGRINIPSKADIEMLSDKITELSAKVEELKKERAHA